MLRGAQGPAESAEQHGAGAAAERAAAGARPGGGVGPALAAAAAGRPWWVVSGVGLVRGLRHLGLPCSAVPPEGGRERRFML